MNVAEKVMGVTFRPAGSRAGDGVLGESGSEPHDRHFPQLRERCIRSRRAFFGGRGYFTAHETRINDPRPKFSVTNEGVSKRRWAQLKNLI